MRALPHALGVVLLSCTAGPLTAREFEPRVTASAIYSDNANRSNTNQIEDTALSALLGFRVREQGTRFNIEADVAALHREYASGDIDSETLPTGFADLTAVVVPERLTWVAQDNIGQVSSEPFDVLAASDRQNANFFSTGPDLFVPFGGRNNFAMRARYGLANYERSQIDDSRYGGEAGVGRILSNDSSIAAVYGYEKIEYDQPIFPQIERDAKFLRYMVQSVRSEVVAELGTESISVGPIGSGSEAHVLLALQRKLSRRMTLSAEYRHGYSDAAENFRADSQDSFTNGGDQDVQVVAGPFKTDEAYLTLQRNAGRTLLAWEAVFSNDKYEATPELDRRLVGSDLLVDYRLSSRMTLAGRARWAQEKLINMELQNSRSELSLGLNQQLSRSLQLVFAVRRTRGTGDLPSDRFSENRITLGINFIGQSDRQRIFGGESQQFRFYQRAGRQVSEPANGAGDQP